METFTVRTDGRRQGRWRWDFVPLVCGLALVIGCGQDGPRRYHLSGKVTYQGQPVPTGQIMFEPDSTKGNRGPQGFAEIHEGTYNTDAVGKGAISGAMIVTIIGFDHMPTGEGGPPPKALFPRYITRVDVPEEATTLDFPIPAGP